MTKVGFWHNVQDTPKVCGLNNASESYFYLEGISQKLGTRKYTVLAKGNLQLSKQGPLNAKKFAITALKIVSFATVVIPVIFLCIKMAFRFSKSYHIEIAKTKSAKTFSKRMPSPGKKVSSNKALKQEAPAVKPKKNLLKPSTIKKTIKLGTYNILFPQRKVNEDGSLPPFSTGMGYNKNNAGQLVPNTNSRTKMTTQNLIKADLDIVCVQELIEGSHQAIGNSLSAKYESVYAKHKNHHGVAVFFDRTRFKLLNQKVLQETFKTVSGNNPNDTIDNQRSCVMVDLKDRTTKKVIRVVSGHFFDPNSFKENKDQYVEWVAKETESQPTVRTLGKKISQAYEISATIIAGDMNQDEYGDRLSSEYSGDQCGKAEGVNRSPKNATVFKPLFNRGYEVDDNLDSTEFWKDLETSEIKSKNRKIDWIFVKGAKPSHHPLKGINLAASDHTLVASSIEL